MTPSALPAALALLAVLLAAKALLLGKPEDAAWAGQFVASTWQDVVCAAVYGLAGATVLRATRERPEARRWLWRAFILAGTLAVAFTVIHVGFYEWSRRALSIQVLRFAGDVRNLRDSITERLTWTSVGSLVLLPFFFAAVFRKLRGSPPRLTALALAVASLWALGGRHLQGRLALEWLDRMSQNPHGAFLSSVWLEATGRAAAGLPRDFPASDLEEFRTFGERSAKAPPPEKPRVKNVIFVVLESTGARYLSLYGSRYETTPRLVEEAKNSLVVDGFYANVGHTVCSFMVLNFSLYPGLPWCYVPCGQRPLPPTLPELLKERGQRTALLSSSDMNYEGMAWAAEGHGYQTIRHYWDMGCPALSSWGSDDRCLFQGVLRFIDEKPGEPFYVMAWTNQTHDPYVLSPEVHPHDFAGIERQRADLGRYLNILRVVDAGIGELLDGLRSRGLDQDTLVVITGDHGEAFGEPHDTVGHGSTLDDESVRVPLVLWNPRLFAGAGRSPRIGSHVDINPTIAELLGVPAPAGWQGHSLLDPQRPDRAYFLAGLGDFLFGVREGPMKYVYSASQGRERLFDLAQDPDEHLDLSAQQPVVAARQRQRLAAWIAAEEQFLKGTPAR